MPGERQIGHEQQKKNKTRHDFVFDYAFAAPVHRLGSARYRRMPAWQL
jgi:hypothetical protein